MAVDMATDWSFSILQYYLLYVLSDSAQGKEKTRPLLPGHSRNQHFLNDGSDLFSNHPEVSFDRRRGLLPAYNPSA